MDFLGSLDRRRILRVVDMGFCAFGAEMKDLDEYTLRELQAELNMRMRRIDQGVCEYCGRTPRAPACRFPERHYRGHDELLNAHLRSLERNTKQAYDPDPLPRKSK